MYWIKTIKIQGEILVMMPESKFTSIRHRAGKLVLVMFLMLWFQIPTGFAQSPLDLKFEKILSDDILGNAVIFTVFQGKQGFLWIGTNQGLIRYDGYRTRLHQSDPQNPDSLSGNIILSLAQDSKGTLWIGIAISGLCSFDPETEKFTRYPSKSINPNDESSDQKSELVFVDSKDILWSGSAGNGLRRYERGTDTFHYYLPDENTPVS